MDVLHYLSLVGLALVACSIAWLIYSRTLHPLSKVPGPFWPSVTRLWYVYHVAKGDMDVVQRALHRQYGPLVRIAPNEIACGDPEALKKIYPIQSPLAKTDFYSVWTNKTFSKYPDNFSVTDEKLHAERLRIVNNVYSMSTVLTLEPYIDKCSALFLERMGEYAFDVVGELFFGQMFGFMEKSHDHEQYIHSLDTLLPVLAAAGVAAPEVRFLILGSSMISSSVRHALKAIDHIAAAARSGVMKRRKEDLEGKVEGRRTDLLHHLLGIVESKGEKVDFGIGEVEYEAYVALFAGSDTTAIALRGVFYYLMKNPSAYKELQEELDRASSSGELSSPPKYSEASKLPYLSATIKEAMQLHPSVGLMMPRYMPAGGLEIAGMYIPAGYKIGMNAAVVGYNEGIYGADPYDFQPSRWLSGDASQMDRYNLVFGAGTRTCIGKNISLSEIYKLVPLVLQRFTLSLEKPSKEWKTEDFWFNKQGGVRVHLTRR